MDVLEIGTISIVYNHCTRLVSVACFYLGLMHLYFCKMLVTMGAMELALVDNLEADVLFGLNRRIGRYIIYCSLKIVSVTFSKLNKI